MVGADASAGGVAWTIAVGDDCAEAFPPAFDAVTTTMRV